LIVDPALPRTSFCLPSTTGSSRKPIPGTRSLSSTQYPHSCPHRSSWLPSANWPRGESCRKAMLLGELSRKSRPDYKWGAGGASTALPPTTQSFRPRRAPRSTYSPQTQLLPLCEASQSLLTSWPLVTRPLMSAPSSPLLGPSCRHRGEVSPQGKEPGGALFSGC